MSNATAPARILVSDRSTRGETMASEHDDAVPSRRPGWLSASSPVATLAGIGGLVIGFVLLTYTWAKVAEESNVARQVPYLVSGGFVGLAFVMTGLLVINIAAKRQDAAERTRQMQRLTEVVRDLQSTIGELDR